MEYDDVIRAAKNYALAVSGHDRAHTHHSDIAIKESAAAEKRAYAVLEHAITAYAVQWAKDCAKNIPDTRDLRKEIDWFPNEMEHLQATVNRLKSVLRDVDSTLSDALNEGGDVADIDDVTRSQLKSLLHIVRNPDVVQS